MATNEGLNKVVLSAVEAMVAREGPGGAFRASTTQRLYDPHSLER